MPNGHGIEKSTFTEADEKTRIALTFDLLEEINDKVVKLETKKWKNTALQFSGGLLGGVTAVIAKMRFF